MNAAKRRGIKIGSALAALAGLSAVVVMSVQQGLPDIGRALASAGWGIAAVTAFHLLPVLASALAWQAAAGTVYTGSPALFLWGRLIRDAVNGLLPVAQVGGNIIGARVMTFHGMKARFAGASILADLTAEFLTQIVFTVIGFAILLDGGGGKLTTWAAIGLAIAVLSAVGFILAQRWGILRLLEKLLDRLATSFDWPALGSLANLHDLTMSIYRDRRAMLGASFWHMASWMLGAVETWLTLMFLGVDISFAHALAIESLCQAISSAAFLVPGALGVQEGGYLILGLHFGFAPEIALALSFIKRIRELALGGPTLLAWQAVEVRRLIKIPERTTKDRP